MPPRPTHHTTPTATRRAPPNLDAKDHRHQPKVQSHSTLSMSVIPNLDEIRRIRDRSRGQWLFFTGDSTLRGMYFALLQQLLWTNASQLLDTSKWSNPPSNATPGWNQQMLPWHPQGWLDLILFESADGSWRVVGASEAEHKCPWPRVRYCLPGVEQSHKLNGLWCREGIGKDTAIRLTYRQLTTLQYTPSALAENEEAWYLPSNCYYGEPSRRVPVVHGPGPDAIILQAGMWDVAYNVEPNITRMPPRFAPTTPFRYH